MRPCSAFKVILMLYASAVVASADEPTTVRVAAAQAQGRVVDFRLDRAGVLAAVDKNIEALEGIVDRAGEAKCDVLVAAAARRA